METVTTDTLPRYAVAIKARPTRAHAERYVVSWRRPGRRRAERVVVFALETAKAIRAALLLEGDDGWRAVLSELRAEGAAACALTHDQLTAQARLSEHVRNPFNGLIAVDGRVRGVESDPVFRQARSSAGGLAAAARMTPEARSERARRAAQAKYERRRLAAETEAGAP